MSEMLDELSNWWSVVVPVVVAVLELGGLVSAWHAVNRVRTPQGAVAWAVGLVTMPVLVLPLYWVFGRNKFAGYREAIRLVEQQYKVSVDAARRALFTGFNAGDPTARSPLTRLADILDTPMSHGNPFELLVDGGPFFERLLGQIASAERYVYAQFYIIRDDDLGNRFADALCERAHAGCTYRYKDGFLHQKCVLVDDQLVLIGSTNLDNRSLHLKLELMLAADEPKLLRQVTEMLEQDFANSVRKDPGKSRLLPWYVRIGTVLARLFSPVL